MVDLNDEVRDAKAQRRLYIFLGAGILMFLVFLLVMTLAATVGANLGSYVILIAMTIVTGIFIVAIAGGLFERFILGGK